MKTLEIKLNDNDITMKWFVNNQNEEKSKIKTDAHKEKYIIKKNIKNIMNQNKNSIKDIEYKLENIITESIIFNFILIFLFFFLSSINWFKLYFLFLKIFYIYFYSFP